MNHLLVKTNLLSYTAPDFPYVGYEWLSQSVLFIINNYFGISGLIILKDILTTSSFVIIFLWSRKRFGKLTISYLALIYLLIFLDRIKLRPELFSYIFTCIFVTSLFSYREHINRSIFWLIPIELLWVNMHIYFIVGPTLICFFIIDGLLLRRDRQYIQNLIILFIGILIACVLNPHGFWGLVYPLTVFQNYGIPIRENLNLIEAQKIQPGMIIVSIWLYGLLLISFLISFLLVFKKTRPIDWMIIWFFWVLGFSATRNIPIFIFTTFIPACYLYSLVIKKYHLIFPLKLWVGVFVICTILVGWFEIRTHGLGWGSIVQGKKAVDFVQANHITGPILNDFDIGDYLAYRYFPREKVFVEARPEAYPKSFFQDVYIPLLVDETMFAKEDAVYHFNVIFLSVGNPDEAGLIKGIVSTKQWNLVYLDKYVMVFLKNNSTNKLIIDKYNIPINLD